MELSSPWKNSKKHILINSVFNTSQIQKISGLVKKLSLDKVDISPSSISCSDLEGVSSQIILDIDF